MAFGIGEASNTIDDSVLATHLEILINIEAAIQKNKLRWQEN